MQNFHSKDYYTYYQTYFAISVLTRRSQKICNCTHSYREKNNSQNFIYSEHTSQSK